MGERSRSYRLVRAIGVFGVGIPLAALAGLYAGSRAAAIEFGNAVFVVTGITAVLWFVFAGWGRRMDAARPSGELFRLSATTYATEVSGGTHDCLPLPTRLLLVLTGTAILGWTVLLATF